MNGNGKAKAIDERTFTPKHGANVVVVRASGHTWLALAGDAGEIVRDQSGGPETTFAVEPGSYTLRSDGKIGRVSSETVELPGPDLPAAAAELAVLRLTSDAKDEHPVDGIGELKADGKSHATISIEKLSAEGTPLRRRGDNDEIFLRTTGGSLQDEAGGSIRSVKLKAGAARFRLVSEAAPKVVTVEALARPPVAPAELRFEFV